MSFVCLMHFQVKRTYVFFYLENKQFTIQLYEVKRNALLIGQLFFILVFYVM
jgi:hypothetical protein